MALVAESKRAGKYPDTEDLDRSAFLDKANDYFSS